MSTTEDDGNHVIPADHRPVTEAYFDPSSGDVTIQESGSLTAWITMHGSDVLEVRE